MTNFLNLLKRTPWILCAVFAYYLPWVWHPTAALTANAYDLAESTSLHPAVRGGSIPLLAPFLLRVILTGLALLAGLYAARASKAWVRWLYIVLALILAVTLFPPFAYFRGASDDPNYRQQFGLAIGTLLGFVGLLILQARPRLRRFQKPLAIAISAAILIAATLGEILAFGTDHSLGLNITLGGGFILLLIFDVLCFVASVVSP